MRSVRSGVGGGGAINALASGVIDALASGVIDTSASGAMRSLLAVSLSLSLFYFPGVEII